MPITDLTGYTWVGNDSIDVTTLPERSPTSESDTVSFDLTFTSTYDSESKNYNYLTIGTANGSSWQMFIYGIAGYGTAALAYMGGWTQESLKTIKISGGTDATNTRLISWLETNGTLTAPPDPQISFGGLNIDDLKLGSNTVNAIYFGSVQLYERVAKSKTWLINEQPYIRSGSYTYTINFTSNNESFNSINMGGDSLDKGMRYYTSTSHVEVYRNGWSNQAYRTVTFETLPTGELLQWLLENAIEILKEFPVKGQLITMQLGNDTPVYGTDNLYRVLKINGSIAEVVAMYDSDKYASFGSTNSYSNSMLDSIVLNGIYYQSLNAAAKAAIVDKNITQYEYTYNALLFDKDTHSSYADYSTKAVKEEVGPRHIYVLDVEDIEEYFGGTFSMSDVLSLLYNNDKASESYPWLRSALKNETEWAWIMNSGIIHKGITENAWYAHPAFTIDLSKIDWSLQTD